MNRIKLKSSIILEAKAIIEKHPSKDTRHFAKAILDFFDLERKETLSQLSSSITENEVLGKITIGCKVNI